MEKGVDIPNPLTLDIGDEVNPDRISGSGVRIYPGCRIYGDRTVIGPGGRIGHEGPVTIENCQLGPGVELKGGYFKESVFFEKASMGLGAHVREACILEEQAGGAHCVGLKQTILFPFVTLGSLINFCDCLMAGGTSRKNHSEVGSSYIHFNFTPNGDKATASLIGDVPRGVMLRSRPIFLGGQGGIVGPLRLGYGSVVAAGTVLRNDVTEENKLIVGKSRRGAVVDYIPKYYGNLSRIVEKNILYLASLVALEEWYVHIRQPIFKTEELGELIFDGAIEKLLLARKERVKRLKAMADIISEVPEKESEGGGDFAEKNDFLDNVDELCEFFTGQGGKGGGSKERDDFLAAFHGFHEEKGGGYLEVIQGLPEVVFRKGTAWLDRTIGDLCEKAASIISTAPRK